MYSCQLFVDGSRLLPLSWSSASYVWFGKAHSSRWSPAGTEGSNSLHTPGRTIRNSSCQQPGGAACRASRNESQNDTRGFEWTENDKSLIGVMLAKAVEVYINSQLESCGDLAVSVSGRNRDLLQGSVQGVQVRAKAARFKGVTISDVDLYASTIQLALSNAGGGGSLLMRPIAVTARLRIRQEDFSASLSSNLLSAALEDLLQGLLPYPGLSWRIQQLQVSLRDGLLYITDTSNRETLPPPRQKRRADGGRDQLPLTLPLAIRLGLDSGGSTIFAQPVSKGGGIGSKYGAKLGSAKIYDLGAGTHIRVLDVSREAITLSGDFVVTP